MDAPQFDRLTQWVSLRSARRGVLNGLVGFSLGLVATRLPQGASARKRPKSNKLQRNDFGCVDVGKACRGNHANCCSGICQGQKPKKGKQDRRACAAHDVGSCTAGQDSCLQGNIACGATGICVQTTGKSGFCGATGICAVCQKDEDCVAMRGPGSACVVCAAACANSTGGTACYAAAD